MTSTAVAKPTPGALVAEYAKDYAMVLPSHIKAEQWVRVSQGLLRRDQKLAAAAAQNPGSLLSALLDCAHKGLEPGDTYHLVPFKGEIVGIVDWKGELEMIYRAGAVASVTCECVYEGDTFKWVPGIMDRPVHEPNWFDPERVTRPMIGVYAYAVMKDGATSRVVVMSSTEVEQVKKVSKTATRSDSMWNVWPDRAWRKTAMHQLAKWTPHSAEYREQVRASAAAIEQVAPALTEQAPALDYPEGDDTITDAEIFCSCETPDFEHGVCKLFGGSM